jgi:hypothetical protein
MAPSLIAINELHAPMPCSENIWRAKFDQWQTLITQITQPPEPLAASPVSICEAFAVVSTQQRILENLSETARLAILLAAFCQHSHIQDLYHALRTAQQESPYGILTTSLQGCLDNVVQYCLDTDCTAEQQHCRLFEDCTIMARTTVILSFVPQKLLLRFSHWQTSSAAREGARQQLRCMMHQHGSRARECAYHAAQLFAHFRKQSQLDHIDPFCLLVATSYLWAYIESAELRTEEGTLPSPSSVGDSIRLDHGLSSADRADWKNLTSGRRPHITGVGALDTARSSTRLLKEASRIMGAGAPRSKLINHISRVLYVQALGYLPVTEMDE